MTYWQVKFWSHVIHCLPRGLIYMCAVAVFHYAITGKYGKTEASSITGMKVLARYLQGRVKKGDKHGTTPHHSREEDEFFHP